MMDALWDGAGWFWSLLLLVPYLSRLSMFVRLIGILGPVGPLLQLVLEKAAATLTLIATYLLKSLWHCLFNPITWGAILLFWVIGPYVQPQDVMHVAAKIKTPTIAARVAPRRQYARPAVSSGSDVRSITLSNFNTH